MQQAGPDVFYIRNGATGCALQFTQDRNSAPVICPPWNGNEPNQHWRFEPVGGGALLISSAFRNPLALPDGARRDGVPLQIYDRNGEGNQRFLVERVGGGPVSVDRGREPEIVRVPDRDRDRDRGRDRPEGPRGT